MSLFTEWRSLSENHDSQEAEIKFWEEYLKEQGLELDYLTPIREYEKQVLSKRK